MANSGPRDRRFLPLRTRRVCKKSAKWRDWSWGSIARDCPSKGAAKCYNCGGEGHIARNCPKGNSYGGGFNSGYGGGGYGPQKTCYSCGGIGHLSLLQLRRLGPPVA
ncbi:uncharacterized protein THITE_113215 [Thermothielavioides terrestris NRRL 8126]|uniref:CCHC-type domain-containing protein n=1 Tax=Thermothielavioides terrestris (strain ATCC 38088 / NRRL 8126) TaxID=578455 RepID=G2QTF5_THETT|nr:uncharacterized protein THITE_113215 [Thermothielavioides terrestris NRRL 8126]AEO63572.1 hypothetical protein THITE_113215 [Thermothielavioides terrestris NRRL 8126]